MYVRCPLFVYSRSTLSPNNARVRAGATHSVKRLLTRWLWWRCCRNDADAVADALNNRAELLEVRSSEPILVFSLWLTRHESQLIDIDFVGDANGYNIYIFIIPGINSVGDG